MALSINTGFANMPRVVVGRKREDIALPALASSVHWLGGFVAYSGTATATPSGEEGGIPTYADDQFIGGFVVGFLDKDGNPIQNKDTTSYKGTLVDATGYLPAKYTFSSTNDEVAAKTGSVTADGEMILVRPIFAEDILEISLWGASTAPVARGTTTAAGVTTSSANFGVSMAVNSTYPFSLLESTAAVTMANLDFRTTRINNKWPMASHRVFASCTRSDAKLVAPN